MSIEEAKQVTASFSGATFVPPPRTISDITAILDQQPRADPEAAAAARARAERTPPPAADPATLVQFYFDRGLAARDIGRARQWIDDLAKALSLAGPGTRLPDYQIMVELAVAEGSSGSLSRAIELCQRAIPRVPPGDRGWLIPLNADLTWMYAARGNFEAAEAALRETGNLYAESQRWQNQRAEWIAGRRAHLAKAQRAVLAAKGEYAKAEAFQRQAVAALAGNPILAKKPWLDLEIAALANLLVSQGRLLEAESEARRALLDILGKQGRYGAQTGRIVRTFEQVIFEQGRYAEAETLARAAIDIFEKTGATGDSLWLAWARSDLAAALGIQARWSDALAQYEAIRRGLTGDPQTAERILGGHVGWATALLASGQPDRSLALYDVALERSRRIMGEQHRRTAEIRGLRARAHAVIGDRPRALREFREAMPVLLTRSSETDDESTTRAAADQRLTLTLTSYMSLLADIQGTALEREAGLDAAAEAFRLADVARGRAVQRALDAGAARAAAKTPALADLVRREQDAAKQVDALQGLLAESLSTATDQQVARVVADLRGRIDSLRRARQTLTEQVAREFPAYAELINPPPATIAQVRAALRAGESLLATYVAEDRTFVWAIPHTGPIAFAAMPLDQADLEQAVTDVRRALDPGARTLGEIPPFELGRAYGLYRTLLLPVRAGWGDAHSLLVVPHGPLGQLPFAVLPTAPVALRAESGALFSNYRAVPWLIRSHAVTVLPSVTALVTLRALPPGDPTRRPFVGFGDPYFSAEQAAEVAQRREPADDELTARGGVSIALRASPRTREANSSRLALLPRLPETADEIRSIAVALNADLTRDVFIGARANEHTVKTVNLSGYRVIVFATHGLVPGDLDGLTQPALALTAPNVAQVEGDGLLTMEKILGLRLNADWVVLSACNTASAQGAGAEAISGLGRAFFYAGARALLVSNWPVETTSARALTTELFRRQQADPTLTRAKALQATMVWMIDSQAFQHRRTKQTVFSYAHPLFWAPFALVGDGGGSTPSQS